MVAVLALAGVHVGRREAVRRPLPDPVPHTARGTRAAAAPSRPRRLLPAVVRRGGRAHQRGRPRLLRQGAHHPDLRGRPARPGGQRAPAGRRLRGGPHPGGAAAARPSSAAYVGATEEQLRLSLLRPVWFTPTIEQSDAGAGVVPLRRHRGHRATRRSPRSTSNIFEALKKPAGRAEFAMCGTAQPGTAGVQPGALPRGPQLEGDLGPRPRRRSRTNGRATPARTWSGTPARPSAPTPPGRSPPTRSTTSGATSGRPRTSGRPARPTAGAGHRIPPSGGLDGWGWAGVCARRHRLWRPGPGRVRRADSGDRLVGAAS